MYYVFILCLIAETIALIFTAKTEEKEKKTSGGVAIFVILISAIISFVTMDIPKPEIFTTNGDSITENEIYIKSEWLLTTYYSLVPYDDPKLNGSKFDNNIPVTETMTVSAKSSFLGIKWSELESKDIIVGSNNLEIIDTDTPGTSIKNITAYFNHNQHFPGDELTLDDFKVEGETISGETVIIDNFEFSPNALVEGKNEISVYYKNLSFSWTQLISQPTIVDITAEYIGKELHVGDSLDNSQFHVTGIYENGTRKDLEAFDIIPSVVDEAGVVSVTIKVGNISTNVSLKVKEKEYIFTALNELHTPNGSYDPKVNVTTWNEDTDYSIDGKTFENGLKITFDNWMSGLMGNGEDFATNVESKLFFSVNQEALEKQSADKRYFDGYFVIGRDTNGSPTTAKITILADDKVVYKSNTITSTSTNIPKFHIPASGVKQIVIKTNARVCGNNFVLGIAFE